MAITLNEGALIRAYSSYTTTVEAEKKKLVDEAKWGFNNETQKSSIIDNFVSAATNTTKNTSFEFEYYQNIFEKEAREEKIANQIEEGINFLASVGKSQQENIEYFANLFNISIEDAANIFTPDFIDDILNDEDENTTTTNNNDNSQKYINTINNSHIELQNSQTGIDSVIMTA